ncbi:hypothetical protein [Amycolatopsis sp. CA-126428]|uniref:hypothetical protein n=1 Tax=Amycolatopsis sp. CA-126428 TaxID=2073158 RepID=UPI0018ECF45D|nr:hypothetical protein [Amycolatopsis sp. CA-126428]
MYRGTKSWWNGKVTTLCGLEIPSGQASSPWFTGPACPSCEAIHKARKNGGK